MTTVLRNETLPDEDLGSLLALVECDDWDEAVLNAVEVAARRPDLEEAVAAAFRKKWGIDAEQKIREVWAGCAAKADAEPKLRMPAAGTATEPKPEAGAEPAPSFRRQTAKVEPDGAAVQGFSSSPVPPTASAQGHWVELDPEPGSLRRGKRRVWVEGPAKPGPLSAEKVTAELRAAFAGPGPVAEALDAAIAGAAKKISPEMQPGDDVGGSSKRREASEPEPDEPGSAAEDEAAPECDNPTEELERKIWRVREALGFIEPNANLVERIGGVIWRTSQGKEIGFECWSQWGRIANAKDRWSRGFEHDDGWYLYRIYGLAQAAGWRYPIITNLNKLDGMTEQAESALIRGGAEIYQAGRDLVRVVTKKWTLERQKDTSGHSGRARPLDKFEVGRHPAQQGR
jgi:hypothetical protein